MIGFLVPIGVEIALDTSLIRGSSMREFRLFSTTVLELLTLFSGWLLPREEMFFFLVLWYLL